MNTKCDAWPNGTKMPKGFGGVIGPSDQCPLRKGHLTISPEAWSSGNTHLWCWNTPGNIILLSMKLCKGWLDQHMSLLTFPSLFLLKAFPSSIHITTPPHASQHLRRVYSCGTHIQLSNFTPEVYWRSGMQVALLNWQWYDTGMQVNEAMFVRMMGWVEKLQGMRRGGIRDRGREDKAGRRWLLSLWVLVLVCSSSPSLRAILSPVGHSTITNCTGKSFTAYILANLLHSSGSEQLQWCSKSVKTTHGPQGTNFILPPDVRCFEWEHGSDDLEFLWLGVYEDKAGKNELIVVFCVRLDRVMEGECQGGCEDDKWEREEFRGEFGYEGEGREGAVSEYWACVLLLILSLYWITWEYMNMEVFIMLVASWLWQASKVIRESRNTDHIQTSTLSCDDSIGWQCPGEACNNTCMNSSENNQSIDPCSSSDPIVDSCKGRVRR